MSRDAIAAEHGDNHKYPIAFASVVVTPLTTVTLAELDRTEFPQGAGLYNFFRQLGGSFGIAGIVTMVAHNTARYRATITEHVTTTDPRPDSASRSCGQLPSPMAVARR